MKTIYDLQIGDSYWSKTETAWATLVACKCKIHDKDNYECYKNELKYGKAFSTEEDCQRSIDYDVALAKITKRASELEERYTEIEDKFFYIIWVDENEKLHWSHHGKTNSFKVAFKSMETAIIIIEELPEEVKIVLGVE